MRLFSREGVIVIVALLCFVPGAIFGHLTGSNLLPDYYLKGTNHDWEKDVVWWLSVGCGIAGSLLGGVAMTVATKKRTSVPNS